MYEGPIGSRHRQPTATKGCSRLLSNKCRSLDRSCPTAFGRRLLRQPRQATSRTACRGKIPRASRPNGRRNSARIRDIGKSRPERRGKGRAITRGGGPQGPQRGCHIAPAEWTTDGRPEFRLRWSLTNGGARHPKQARGEFALDEEVDKNRKHHADHPPPQQLPNHPEDNKDSSTYIIRNHQSIERTNKSEAHALFPH